VSLCGRVLGAAPAAASDSTGLRAIPARSVRPAVDTERLSFLHGKRMAGDPVSVVCAASITICGQSLRLRGK
jgi:hypothetical protein